MYYRNLDDLNQSYRDGTFSYPDEIEVDGIKYFHGGSSNYPLEEMLSDKFGIVSYVPESRDNDVLYLISESRPLNVISLNEEETKDDSKSGEDKDVVRNQMDKHKNHLDSHINKHNSALADLRQQIHDATGSHKEDLKATLDAVQQIVDSHKEEMSSMASEFQSKIEELDRKHEELLKAHNEAIDRLSSDHSDKLSDLKSTHEEIKKLHDERIRQMQRDHEEHKTKMSDDHERHIRKMVDDYSSKFHQMKRDHGDKIHDMKRSHDDQMRKVQQSYEDKLGSTVKSHEENQEQLVRKHSEEINSVHQKHSESKIGTESYVEISNLHESPPLKAKIDTGATICSLHVDEMKIDKANNRVKFMNKELNPKFAISAPIASMSSVRSADGGMTYRPVILLNLRIKGKDIQNVEVNLNDREHMTHPFLVGHNALEKGKFIIDPSYVGERVDFDLVQKILTESSIRSFT